MRRRIALIIGLTTVLVLVGCGDDLATGLRGVAVAGGDSEVLVTVSGGVFPDVAWTGGAARRLVIARADGGGVFWEIEALDLQAGFPPPVEYGITPAFAREVTDEAILTAGDAYRVAVTLVDGSTGVRLFQPTRPSDPLTPF